MTRSRPGLSFPTLISTTHDAHDDRCYIGIGQLRHEASRNAGIEPELFAEQALHSTADFVHTRAFLYGEEPYCKAPMKNGMLRQSKTDHSDQPSRAWSIRNAIDQTSQVEPI